MRSTLFATLAALLWDVLSKGLNWTGATVDRVLLLEPPSADPALAGARPAILATIYLGVLRIAFTVPLGVGTALYLEEYADKDRWYNRLLEINIQNLAAVPSIVYGILGLAFLVRGIGLGRVLLSGALLDRKHLALRFEVPLDHVTVRAPFVGGGFGGKGSVWSGTLLTVMAARVTGRPVRMALSREAVYRTVGGRTPSAQRVALGATADGRLTALVHESTVRSSPVGGAMEQVVASSGELYAAEHIALRSSVVELDLLPNTAMRAPGEAIGSFALESAMDQLAHDLGLDPVELRLRNEPERSPLHGRAFSHRRVARVVEDGALCCS